jgi:hypothetical protein
MVNGALETVIPGREARADDDEARSRRSRNAPPQSIDSIDFFSQHDR